jgi:hypothetical protein
VSPRCRGKNAAFYLENLAWKTLGFNALANDGASALPLLVARILADDVDHAPAAHDLAVLADLLD